MLVEIAAEHSAGVLPTGTSPSPMQVDATPPAVPFPADALTPQSNDPPAAI